MKKKEEEVSVCPGRSPNYVHQQVDITTSGKSYSKLWNISRRCLYQKTLGISFALILVY